MISNDKKFNGNDSSFIDVLKSEVRFRIFSLFNLYPELSLTELKDIMNRSKSTIHHHLDKLIEAGLIEVSREEKVRGNILKKYYSLKIGYQKNLESTDSNLHEANKNTFEFYGTYVNSAIRTLELYKNFFEKLQQDENGYEHLREIILEEQGFSSMLFFSKEQFRKVLVIYNEFIDKINKIDAEVNGIKVEKPYYVFTFGMPLKQIIEEIGKMPTPPAPLTPPSPPAPLSPASLSPPKPSPHKTKRHK
ncbi:MAG: ArsR/SmtB family transcription factor [Candidatus Odinarchaeota archaeon]